LRPIVNSGEREAVTPLVAPPPYFCTFSSNIRGVAETAEGRTRFPTAALS
jgi:hypothetical protein